MNNSLEKLNYYLSLKQKIYLFILLIIFIINSFLEIISIGSIPILIGYLLSPDEFLQKIPFENIKSFINSFLENRNTSEVTGIACVAIFFIFVFKNLYYLFTYYFELKISKTVTLATNLRLFKSYLYAPYETHLLTNPSYIIRNLLYSNTASNQIITIIRLVKEILMISAIILLIVFFSFNISIIIISSIFIFLVGIFILIGNTVKQRGEKNALNSNEIIKTINQFIGSLIEIKTKGKENFFFRKYGSTIFDFESNNLFIKFVKSSPKIFIEIISGGGLLLMVFVLTKDKELIELIPFLALLTLAIVRVLPSANAIMTAITDFKQQKVYFDIIFDELKKNDSKNIEKKLNEKRVLKKINDNIELKNISFSYKNTPEKSISNINIKIKRGEKVGISGVSGSGKSTLLKIILGLLKPQYGEIFIDGKKISDISKVLWENISYVPQETYIFDETIENNIAFGSLNENTDSDKLSKIIECVELKKLIKESINGINTKVGDRGIRISGGQKQRIAIARALYSQPDLLFLDEATSNIDLETEKIIFQNLKKFSKEMTIISISHRKNAFMDYDNVYIIDKGQLIN